MVEIVTNGNIALAHGFLTYGLEAAAGPGRRSKTTLFGAGYPITPVNEISEWGMRELRQYGGQFIQAESELAAINMVLGAASVGVPAFTVSSSPGISLMQEGISYAIGMELPLVVANVVRGGPGLGNIQGAQSDLKMTLSGGHGDLPPLVFAPASCQEMYDFGRLAFEYSARYRMPSVVLSDGYLGQLWEKYSIADSIQPKEFYDQRDVRTSIYVREGILAAHNWKLCRRFQQVQQDTSLQALSMSMYRSQEDHTPADILIVSYGIFSRIGYGVVDRARKEGLSVGQVSLKVLSPLPGEQLRQLARRHKALYVLEGSCGQLCELVRQKVGQVPLIGLGAFPGGDLPSEEEIVQGLVRLSEQLTADYLGWKTEALALEEKARAFQSQITPDRGAAYRLIADHEATYPYETRANRKKRVKRTNEIMTDVPFSYCAGCGETTAVMAIGKVLAHLRQFDIVLYSPVGCSIFLYDYFKPEFVRNVQVPHGRGPAAASASKRVAPDKIHLCVQGDGDALDIGLNELLHAIERGDNITVVLFNNGTYGMTGGQASSSTPLGQFSTTTRQGRDAALHGHPLDLAVLASHPGVAYFRRDLAGTPEELHQFESDLANAIYHQMAGHGVSIIEVFTACPSRQKPGAQLLQELRNQGIKANGDVQESIQYAARVLPPGKEALKVRWGDDVEDPYSELEKIRDKAVSDKLSAEDEVPTADSRRLTASNIWPEAISRRYAVQSAKSKRKESLPDLTLFLGGIGGQGIQSLAEILSLSLVGVYENFTYSPWYEPEVTRALTTASLLFTNRGHVNPILQPGEVDMMLVMKERILETREKMLRPGGLLLYDCDEGELPDHLSGCQIIPVPATTTAKKQLSEPRCANAVLLGALAQLLEVLDPDRVKEVIRRLIPKADLNLRAFEEGLHLSVSQKLAVGR